MADLHKTYTREAILALHSSDRKVAATLSRTQIWNGIAHNRVTIDNIFDRLDGILAEDTEARLPGNLVNLACDRFADNFELLDALFVRGFDSLATALHQDKLASSADPED